MRRLVDVTLSCLLSISNNVQSAEGFTKPLSRHPPAAFTVFTLHFSFEAYCKNASLRRQSQGRPAQYRIRRPVARRRLDGLTTRYARFLLLPALSQVPGGPNDRLTANTPLGQAVRSAADELEHLTRLVSTAPVVVSSIDLILGGRGARPSL